jgi:hypothetical protein
MFFQNGQRRKSDMSNAVVNDLQTGEFSAEQKNFLQGFVSGSDLARNAHGLSTFAAALGLTPAGTTSVASQPNIVPLPSGPDAIHIEAQNRFLAEGKTLCTEEQAKRAKTHWTRGTNYSSTQAKTARPEAATSFASRHMACFMSHRRRIRLCAACVFTAAFSTHIRCVASPIFRSSSAAVMPMSRHGPIYRSAKSRCRTAHSY